MRQRIRRQGSAALDLKHPGGRDAALHLCDGADIVFEGFQPGVMESLGLGPEVVLARHPAVVYGCMTGWGQTGPLADTPGHDINYIALTGALRAIGQGQIVDAAIVDGAASSMTAFYGMLAAGSVVEQRESKARAQSHFRQYLQAEDARRMDSAAAAGRTMFRASAHHERSPFASAPCGPELVREYRRRGPASPRATILANRKSGKKRTRCCRPTHRG